MRTLRMTLVGAITLALLSGPSVAVVAQAEGDEAVQPPTEFSGRLSCPIATDWQQGSVTDVVLGPMGEGNLVRREARGGFFRPVVEEMSDSRLAGTWTAYLDTDEYIYPGVDVEDHPVLMTGMQRIEDDEGAWQGSAPDAIVPDAPLTTWGLVSLTGEGAYEGLTALQWANLVDDTCSCGNPDNLCEWDIRGLVFEGEMPPVPGLGGPEVDEEVAAIPTKEVVVATQTIEKGTTIGPEVVSLRAVPIDEPNKYALTDPREVVGRVAAIDILESQVLAPNLLEPPTE